jgi:NADPH-dependent 2,4-dienoyl-CoA reductase/sulfur reductase-like enzyme
MSERLIVIGGCAAGMSAAAKARRLHPQLEIAVYEKTGFISYGECGLPYYVSGAVKDHNDLVVRTPAQFAQQNIEINLHHEVTEIDAENRRVRVVNLKSSETRVEAYDKLVIATGGRPIVLPNFPLGNRSGAFVMRAVEDGIAIREFIRRERPRRAVIVGAGYIGLEMADTLGLEITVIGRPPQVLKRFDPDMAQWVQEGLESKGIQLSLGDEAEALESDAQGHVRQVVSSNGSFEANLILLALGVRPNVELAKEAGVALGETGAIATDVRMCTNLPSIFAAGDCAEAYHRITGHAAYIPLGTTANKQGRVAGTNIAGGNATFEGIVGTAITQVFGLQAGMTGLAEREAKEQGYAVKAVKIKSRSRAHYYPGSKPLHIKLIFEEGSGRLLGGQIVGGEGVNGRIDVLAAALHRGMTIEELAQLDLAYVPPLAPVWDPLLVAANVALKG